MQRTDGRIHTGPAPPRWQGSCRVRPGAHCTVTPLWHAPGPDREVRHAARRSRAEGPAVPRRAHARGLEPGAARLRGRRRPRHGPRRRVPAASPAPAPPRSRWRRPWSAPGCGSSPPSGPSAPACATRGRSGAGGPGAGAAPTARQPKVSNVATPCIAARLERQPQLSMVRHERSRRTDTRSASARYSGFGSATGTLTLLPPRWPQRRHRSRRPASVRRASSGWRARSCHGRTRAVWPHAARPAGARCAGPVAAPRTSARGARRAPRSRDGGFGYPIPVFLSDGP